MLRKLMYRVGLPAVLAVATAVGVWAAVDQHRRVSPKPEEGSDVTLSVLKVESDPVQVRVTIRLEGANPKGGTVTFGPTFLASGEKAVPLLRSSAKPEDPLLVTLTFPPLDSGKMTLRLGPAYPASTLDGSAKAALVGAQEVELPSAEQSDGNAVVPALVTDAFPGGLAPSVEKVTFSDSGPLTEGHLSGLSETDIAAVMVSSVLTTKSGHDISIVVGRFGFGRGLAQFSLLYPKLDEPATLVMKVHADTASPAFGTLDADSRARLAGLEHASVEWTIRQ